MKLLTRLGAATLVLALTNAAFAGAIEDARKALERGDFAKAAEIARKVPESSKDRPKAMCIAGEAELAQDNGSAAETAFREALDKKTDFVPAMAGLGRALVRQGKLDEASPLLSKAVKLDNMCVDAWQAQCELFIARGKPADLEGARGNLVNTLMLDAKNPVTNRMLVEVLLKLDKVDDASKAAETFAKVDKDGAMVWFVRGLVSEKRAETDKAIDAYEKAVKKDDRLRDAHRNVALLLDAKSPDRARAHAQRYVDLGGKEKSVVDLLEKLKAAKPAEK